MNIGNYQVGVARPSGEALQKRLMNVLVHDTLEHKLKQNGKIYCMNIW
jgi:hypothetical protein